MLYRSGFLVLALGATRVLGALFQGPTEEVLKGSYDVIVVGGGAGGGAMASRLSEDPDIRVLLIEAGSSDITNLNSTVPGLANNLVMSAFDWNFTTTPQAGYNGRSIDYPRGFVLGGSTAINQMLFCRGTVDDYDRWARVTGDEGWSWKSLAPFIFAVDHMTPPVDHHNTTGEFNPVLHKNGPVSISVDSLILDTNTRVLETTQQLPDLFPFNLDYNSGTSVGVAWKQNAILNGHRVTSATSYLAQAMNRKNLDVVVNTRVTKVFPVGTEDGKPVFRGVEFAQTADGPRHTLKATQEVILSAGSLKTPHILMLSGIGDSAHLSSFGIKTIVDLPGVGQNLHDHAFLGNSWTVNSTNTLDDLQRNATAAAEALALWKANATGPLSVAAGSSQFGFVRIPNATAFFQQFGVEDPSAGPTSGHIEHIPTNSYVSTTVPIPAEGHFFAIITAVISPTARGNVTLRSSDPFDAPLINPALLGNDVDLAIMREGVKAARAFVKAPAWSGYIISEFGEFGNATTEDALNEYIRNNSATVDHPVGSVAMGKDEPAPLTPDLKVRGTVGLRVVDASAFPFIPSGHTQGPTYILAERAAHLVRADLKK
ncbi:alcohol oxidase [Dichomitus squalens LYAD-421 SS1]|uniref:alcohol oxidase n=1 Tax=Dichomitus squalens (strain LYAD-421) TaxID=732165 RepID=UPI0004415A72|nr:alcohol oxidase [Dichomitus squalens LYAD-421 SS1]EJF63375.1 alcohol oxidase [Dichomitus squalens LYAD-421 SS1]